MNIASLFQNISKGGGGCVAPLDPSFQDKSEVSKKYQLTGYEWTQNASFASVFQKIFSGRPRPSPLLREHKKLPSLAEYDPLQLSWKFSRNTYIEDRSFEGKTYTQFLGKKSTRTRQKMDSECTICIHFSKIFSGRPRPPPPLLQEHKNPLFDCIWPSTAKLKILPQYVCRRSELWGQKLHTIFGEVINTNSAKNGLRMHHLHPFFKKFPGGGPPGPPPAGGGLPLPHPPPAALRADLVTPPRQWTLWIRHWQKDTSAII